MLRDQCAKVNVLQERVDLGFWFSRHSIVVSLLRYSILKLEIIAVFLHSVFLALDSALELLSFIFAA